jgi:hypothetical protein
LILPGLQGPAKRAFFNKVCLWTLAGFAMGSAMLGFGLAGPLGALIGLVAGLGVCGTLLEKGGSPRP